MNEFVQRHAEKVLGSMSGFDRLWFKGTLRFIAHVAGLLAYMRCREGGGGNLLKEFKDWSLSITERVKQGAREAMRQAGGEVIYLNRSQASKEEIARGIARERNITQGAVCLLETVEQCRTYEIHRNRERKLLELQSKSGMCLHQYAYWMDEQVGMCSVRMQTWLPLEVKVSMNGREWLCRDMEKREIWHERRDNCVTRLEAGDFGRVQGILEEQLKTDWGKLLGRLLKRANPVLSAVLLMEGRGLDRYWSLEQSEWATDILFKESSELGRLYPLLARQAMLGMGSVDVMRFLGAPVSCQGTIRRGFDREVVSDLKQRREGMRVKHRVGHNSVKMYDKQAVVLRTETTIHEPRKLRTYRGTESNPEDKKWRACRKGVADLHRVAEIAEKSNQRYLSSLSKMECDTRVGELLGGLCKRVSVKGRQYRGLRPLEENDGRLLEAVGRGEWVINGFTNGQLRGVMYEGKSADKREERQRGARVSRQLALLRAHGLVHRMGTSRRWMLTDQGREAVALTAAAKHACVKDLLKKAA